MSFPAVMGRLKVLDGKGEEIGYGEKQTTRISFLTFLSWFMAEMELNEKPHYLQCVAVVLKFF